MPKLLVDRFAEDSINQFRAAARIRSDDAQRLAGSGRGAAAVYLWGYVAEMVLKAAWFRLIGYADDRPISLADLRQAVGQYHIPGRHNLHDVELFAGLLVQRETLRYKRNRPYPYEVEIVAESAGWLLSNALLL